MLSWLAVLLTIVGIVSYWFWVYLQYTPLWLKMIMGYKVLLGPEAPWLQQLLQIVARKGHESLAKLILRQAQQ